MAWGSFNVVYSFRALPITRFLSFLNFLQGPAFISQHKVIILCISFYSSAAANRTTHNPLLYSPQSDHIKCLIF